MTLHELKQIVKYIRTNCVCPKCQSKYHISDIHVVATNDCEGVFELDCRNCDCMILMNLFMSADGQDIIEDIPDVDFNDAPQHAGLNKVNHNDILDIKNFLSKFDGNFKRVIRQDKQS